jgi:hypothetical protein
MQGEIGFCFSSWFYMLAFPQLLVHSFLPEAGKLGFGGQKSLFNPIKQEYQYLLG